MVLSVNESRILTPFRPSLQHLCIVTIAIPLLNDFGIETLEVAYEEVQRANTSASSEENRDINYKRAKGKLLSIPPLLRKRVMEAMNGVIYRNIEWRIHNLEFVRLENEPFIIYYRSDGLIDTYKTVQQLVLDGRIDTESRFTIACKYCFEESIRTLWSQMQPSGERNVFETGDDLVRFWVRWLQEGSRAPWIQAAGECLDEIFIDIPRFSSFFPFLLPEDRKRFLSSLRFAVGDDLRLCLYSMTREEAEPILEDVALEVLLYFLDWPLQSEFLETVENLHPFIDDLTFNCLLQDMLFKKNESKDFDYGTLFEDFWESFQYISGKLQFIGRKSSVQ